MAIIRELLIADKIDLEYLIRYTNAPWLVIQEEGSPDHGLFARNDDGAPLAYDASTNTILRATAAEISPAIMGCYELEGGRKAVPAFELMVRRYLSSEYTPENVAAKCGIPAETIKRIASEIAAVAFDQTIEIEAEWTDWAGRKHDKFIGRPVSMHAMRGISVHSNGFQTCRAIHILQMLIGSIDVPGGFRYKPPFPKPAPPPLKPAGKVDEINANTPMPGPPLGFTQGPDDLLVNPDGDPIRIDKAYSWEAHGSTWPAAHGD